jgi:hypothetical protein
MHPAPRISVIVPLADHRGHAVEAIRSWTREQTLPRNDYQVVVVIDGHEPQVESAVATLLGPGDKLVRAAHDALHVCYNAGTFSRGREAFSGRSERRRPGAGRKLPHCSLHRAGARLAGNQICGSRLVGAGLAPRLSFFEQGILSCVPRDVEWANSPGQSRSDRRDNDPEDLRTRELF